MLPNERIGRYKILSKIGEGGMGEVYLAQDDKLDRRVALKILPADVAGDADRMLRFEHEAKSASALNHPNIITIYEINDENDNLFIAMEYVEGETLAKKIKSSEFDLKKTLDIAIQIAAALTAAHEAKVIHRDIKPDNIIVRPDGLVKILDFGLAKLTEKTVPYDLEALTTLVKTNPGLVMGTVGYMSPEQARGASVDARSDIFSFGAMLYEMLAGRRPFAGENEVDVMASILHKDPSPLTKFAPEVSHEIESLVRKTLRKNRDERYQTVRELLADLRDLREELNLEIKGEYARSRTGDFENVAVTDDALAKPLITARRSRFTTNSIREVILDEVKIHPIATALTLLVVAAIVITVGSGLNKSSSEVPESFQTMRLAKLTSSGNVASEQAAVSPDGKYIAYVAQESGSQSLWVKQAAASSNVQIVPPADVRYDGLTFSPDGVYIYYASAEIKGSPAVYQVPVLGGQSRKLLTEANGPIAFSPDGNRIAFVRRETFLMTANPDGSETQIIASTADGRRWFRLTWSPDGNNIVAAVFSPVDSRDHLVEIAVKDATERQFPSPPWLRLRGLAWLPDASGLIVSGRDPETQLTQLWLIGYPDGQARRITNDLDNYQGLSLTTDGRTLVSVQENRLSNIWLTPASDAVPARKLTTEFGRDDGMSGISFTPDGRIVYTVRVKGTQDLWIVNRDGSENRQLTFNSQSNFSPAVSPDGRYIVFVSTRGGNLSLWRMDIDGDNPFQLTDDPGSEAEPSLSGDGKWVVYQLVDRDSKTAVWKVSIDGGSPVQLTNIASKNPTVSPDGKFIACVYGETTPVSSAKLAIIPLDGGSPIGIYDWPMVVKSRTFRWSSDGKALIYFDSRNRVDNLWSQSLDGAPPSQMTDFKSDRIFRFAVSRDDGQFALARGSETSEAVMISNFR